MADIWQQFHSLPKAIRDGVATPAAIAAVDAIEAEYPNVDLANLIMRLVVHEFAFQELPAKLAAESKLEITASSRIADRLRREVFTGVVGDYLGLKPAPAVTVSTPPPLVQPKPPLPPPTPLSKPLVPRPIPPPNLPIVPTPPVTTPAPRPVSVSKPTMPTRPSVPIAPSSPVGALSPTTHYSDDDAAEIDAQVTHLKQLASNNPNQDLEMIARSMLKSQNLAFSDELLDRRSVAIIKARLKGVRTTDETRDILARDTKIGGLGLDRELAASLAVAAEHSAVELKSRGMVKLPEQPAMPQPPVVPSVMQTKPEPKPPFRRTGSSPNPVIPNVTEAPRASRPIVRPADIPAPMPMPAPRPVKPPVAPAMSTVEVRARQSDRPTMSDIVRPSTQALGPAEELRSMSLLDFRRLGQGAGESTRRLLDKFDHLKRESFAVWAEAIKGWRQSEVMHLYLAMGRESLEQGTAISQIIANRTRQGQPYLSEHEFTVLADMNRQLQS